MDCVVTWNETRNIPVLTLSSESDGDELSLQMLADSSNFKIVIELPEADELIVKNIMTEPAEESD